MMNAVDVGPRRPVHVEEQQDFITLLDIWQFLLRNAGLLTLSVGCSVGLALVYLMQATPLYTARAELLLDPKQSHAVRDQSVEGGGSLDGSQMESQLAVLRSENIATSVASALKLGSDPDFNGERGGGLLAKLLGSSTVQRSNDEKTRAAVGTLRQGLSVRRLGTSHAIEVEFASPSPIKAAQVVNATTAAYLQDVVEARGSAARIGSEWLQARVEELRQKMNDAARRAQELRASHDYRIPSRRQDDVSVNAAAPPGDVSTRPATTLEELESTALTYRKSYETFYQAFAEAVQRESYPVSNARVISPASPYIGKSHPKTNLILAFAGLAGTLAGLGLALARQSLSHVVSKPSALQHELGIACLSEVPRLSGTSGPLKGKTGLAVRVPMTVRLKGSDTKTRGPTNVGGAPSILREVTTAPLSPFAAAVRRIKTGILIASRSKSLRVIGITSAQPEEGKSTIAASLAAHYAAVGIQTLLVDADVSGAGLTRDLAADAEIGLLEVVSGERALHEAVVRPDCLGGSDLLPLIQRTPHHASHEFLASNEMYNCLQTVSSHYAIAIVDLPPVKLVTEGLVLCSRMDGVVLISEWEVTPVSALRDTVLALRMAGADVLGAVINKVRVRSLGAIVREYRPQVRRA